MTNIIEFTKTLNNILNQPILIKENKYLDLSQVNELTKNMLEKANIYPEPDPIAEAVFLVIDTMKESYLTLTKIGINEILKTYLKTINKNNQKDCTELFSDYIFQIYLFSLQKDYPYTDLIWGYLSSCFHIISQFLLEEELIEGCQIFLQKIATMGKTAAQKGLHTSSIQHFLHTLELRAYELGFKELAAIAKNHRFNLETF